MAPRAAQGTAHILVREALLGLEAGRLERVGVGRHHGISHVRLEVVVDGGGDVLLDGQRRRAPVDGALALEAHLGLAQEAHRDLGECGVGVDRELEPPRELDLRDLEQQLERYVVRAFDGDLAAGGGGLEAGCVGGSRQGVWRRGGLEAEGGGRELGWAAAGWVGPHAACTVHDGFHETLHSE